MALTDAQLKKSQTIKTLVVLVFMLLGGFQGTLWPMEAVKGLYLPDVILPVFFVFLVFAAIASSLYYLLGAWLLAKQLPRILVADHPVVPYFTDFSWIWFIVISSYVLSVPIILIRASAGEIVDTTVGWLIYVLFLAWNVALNVWILPKFYTDRQKHYILGVVLNAKVAAFFHRPKAAE